MWSFCTFLRFCRFKVLIRVPGFADELDIIHLTKQSLRLYLVQVNIDRNRRIIYGTYSSESQTKLRSERTQGNQLYTKNAVGTVYHNRTNALIMCHVRNYNGWAYRLFCNRFLMAIGAKTWVKMIDTTTFFPRANPAWISTEFQLSSKILIARSQLPHSPVWVPTWNFVWNREVPSTSTQLR